MKLEKNILSCSLLLTSLIASSAFSAPIDTTVKCYNFISSQRKIKSFDGYYRDGAKTRNVLEDLNRRLNKLSNLQNRSASSSTRETAKVIRLNLENYYQCDSAGNPIPNLFDKKDPRKESLEETLQKYDMLCLPTQRGIKKIKISDMQAFIKELENLNKVSRENYDESFATAVANLEKNSSFSRYDRLSNSQLNAVILKRALPKSNLRSESKDFDENYVSSCSETLRDNIDSGAALQKIRSNPYIERPRYRPGSATR